MPRKKGQTRDEKVEDTGQHLSQDPKTMEEAMSPLFRDFTPVAAVFNKLNCKKFGEERTQFSGLPQCTMPQKKVMLRGSRQVGATNLDILFCQSFCLQETQINIVLIL